MALTPSQLPCEILRLPLNVWNSDTEPSQDIKKKWREETLYLLLLLLPGEMSLARIVIRIEWSPPHCIYHNPIFKLVNVNCSLFLHAVVV